LASEVLAATGALALLALLYPRQVRARAVYAGKALGTAAVVELVLVAWPLWVQFLGQSIRTLPSSALAWP
jgi:hypothetical protein